MRRAVAGLLTEPLRADRRSHVFLETYGPAKRRGRETLAERCTTKAKTAVSLATAAVNVPILVTEL